MIGTIFDIKKYAIHDGPGIRTTVFLKGCPLDCLWCHNPESRSIVPEEIRNYRSHPTSSKKIIGKRLSVDEIMNEILKDELFYDESAGGVTFSGGEPMLQIDFLQALLEKCRENGLHTTVDTCGNVDWTDFLKIYKLVDLFLFDLKIIEDTKHIQYTTVSNKLILENLEKLTKTGVEIRIRIPLIENITDTDENIESIISYIKKFSSLKNIDILPYNKFGQDKIERYQLERTHLDLSVQTDEKINHIQKVFQTNGYDVHIGG